MSALLLSACSNSTDSTTQPLPGKETASLVTELPTVDLVIEETSSTDTSQVLETKTPSMPLSPSMSPESQVTNSFPGTTLEATETPTLAFQSTQDASLPGLAPFPFTTMNSDGDAPATDAITAQSADNPSQTQISPTRSSLPISANNRVALLPTPIDPPPASQKQGWKAPIFDLDVINLTGQEKIKLDSLFGNPLLISFGGSWCVECEKTVPVLIEMHKKYGDRVQFLEVAIEDNRASGEKYNQKFNFPFPVLLDLEGRWTYEFRAPGGYVPVLFFVDANGNILNYISGRMSPEQLETAILKLLDEI